MTAQGASPGVGVARLKSPEGATQMDRPLVGLEPTQVEPLAFKARVVQSAVSGMQYHPDSSPSHWPPTPGP
jgi:hypothetical protein